MQRLIWILLAMWAPFAHTEEVWQVRWPSQNTAPPAKVEGDAARFLPSFRLALNSLPEGAVVSLALSQPAMLGITPAHAKTLQPLVADPYRRIVASETWRNVPSMLSYCFSAAKPDHGLATVRIPEGVGPQSPVILFLYGYGGSFLWYQHHLARHFPKHIIICPAWGISPASIPPAYLQECLVAVQTRTGHALAKPWLLGLSAGGFGACRVANAAADAFAGMICIAAYPLSSPVVRSNPHFIAGSEETFVKSGYFGRTTAASKHHLIQGGDHFFLLTHPDETMAKLTEWMNAR